MSPYHDNSPHSVGHRTHSAALNVMDSPLPPPASASKSTERVAQASGFSLHARAAGEAEQRDKLERLCRSISRPAVASERLILLSQGPL
jgi:hypothetical protein